MITNMPNLGMNYVNYKTSIVQKYHVQLLGWPSDIPFVNPHQLTTVATARTLQNTLTVSTCKWVAMSKRQQQEHAATLVANVEGGQVIGKKRKERSDKGKKHKHTLATDDEGDDEDEEADNNGDENERPAPAKKQRSAATGKRPKGSANKSKAATASSKSKADAAKKAKRVAGTLPPIPPKSKEFIDTEDDSDN